jgi:hypothetical protein
VYYGVIATVAAASAWQILAGLSQKPLWSQVAWLVLCGGAMVGLPLLKRWGRWLAMVAAAWMVLTILAVAAWFVAMRSPGFGLVAALAVAAPALIIRSLQRPAVKTWFV